MASTAGRKPGIWIGSVWFALTAKPTAWDRFWVWMLHGWRYEERPAAPLAAANDHEREFWDTRPALRSAVAIICVLATIALGCTVAILWAVF